MTTTCLLAWDAKCADCGGTMKCGTYAQYSEETGVAMGHVNGCPKQRAGTAAGD